MKMNEVIERIDESEKKWKCIENKKFVNDLMIECEKVMNATGHNRKGMHNNFLRMEFERAYALHCILEFIYDNLMVDNTSLNDEITNARLTFDSEYIDIENKYISIWRIADISVRIRENNLLWSLIEFVGKATTPTEVARKYMACKCILGDI